MAQEEPIVPISGDSGKMRASSDGDLEESAFVVSRSISPRRSSREGMGVCLSRGNIAEHLRKYRDSRDAELDHERKSKRRGDANRPHERKQMENGIIGREGEKSHNGIEVD